MNATADEDVHRATEILLRKPCPANVSVTISEAEPADADAWNAYVFGRDDTTFVDNWQWREVLERSYDLPAHWYIARRNDEICGILGLTLTRHPILGTYLATAPFANYGGFYYDDLEARDALLAKAEALRDELGARYVNIRHFRPAATIPEHWRDDPAYATYWLALPPDPEDFLRKHLGASARRLVGKSAANGFRTAFGGMELMDDFWRVIGQSMKELGSPYHSRHYLENIIQIFGDAAQLGVMYSRTGEPVGASLLIAHGTSVVQLHANVLRSQRSLFPGEYLYYSVIAECCRRGVKMLDLGRSLVGSGNETFKLKWRPDTKALAYWYHLAPGVETLPALNQANPRLKVAVRAWQSLPLWTQRSLGPRLITGIL
jgi:FemAB-related protein (PEP-CTERM system-associated)